MHSVNGVSKSWTTITLEKKWKSFIIIEKFITLNGVFIRCVTD